MTDTSEFTVFGKQQKSWEIARKCDAQCKPVACPNVLLFGDSIGCLQWSLLKSLRSLSEAINAGNILDTVPGSRESIYAWHSAMEASSWYRLYSEMQQIMDHRFPSCKTAANWTSCIILEREEPLPERVGYCKNNRVCSRINVKNKLIWQFDSSCNSAAIGGSRPIQQSSNSAAWRPIDGSGSQCTNVSHQANQQYNQQSVAFQPIFVSSSSIRIIHLFIFCIAFVFTGLYLEGILHWKINISDSNIHSQYSAIYILIPGILKS